MATVMHAVEICFNTRWMSVIVLRMMAKQIVINLSVYTVYCAP